MIKAGRLPADMEARRNVKTVYALGNHSVEIVGNAGRWTATVDGKPLDDWFGTSADAWTAGVMEADSQDAGVAALPCVSVDGPRGLPQPGDGRGTP